MAKTVQYKQDTVNVWFPDQREPTHDPKDFISNYQFKEYWKREKDRLINGFYIADGQVFIPGFLYWHTVYWKIAMYLENPITGRKQRIIRTPYLRDIEWDVSNDFEACMDQGRFYNLVGSRDFGKSILAASRAGYIYTLFDNSECIISSSEYKHIKLATDKIEDGLTNLHPILKKQRIISNWKEEVKAGWKDKKTNTPSEKASNSHILIRNYEHGNNSMAAVGTRPGFHLIDEQGTLENFIGCIKDSDGAWWSGGGSKPSCLAMFTGTGGDMEVGKEAAEVFYKPFEYNILAFDDVWEGKGKIGRFISALRAKQTFKEPKKLSEYIGISHPDLDKITILVSNEERAKKEWYDIEYKKAQKTNNSKALLKFKAYWPLVPSDAFLVLTQNDFNVEAAKVQQKKLDDIGQIGTAVELYHDGETIRHKHSNLLRITEFPCKAEDKNAPIIIYEFPDTNSPFGLYTCGVDSYVQEESEYSESVGSVYIFKRIHNILSERYQNMIVASYAARPNDKKVWQEQARLLIKYYNARTLVENDEISFIDYMIGKGDGHFLEDQPEWMKEYVHNTNMKRNKGLSRASKAMRDYLDEQLATYLDEVIHVERDDDGNIVREVLGVTRIQDRMLLEEIMKFNKKEGNFDRVVAAELAITLANRLNPIVQVSSSESDPRLLSLKRRIDGKKRGSTPLFKPMQSGTVKKKYYKLFR